MIYQNNNSSEIKDYLDIAKQGISTFYNIGQMARYRVDYLVRNQNKDKMILHACFAGLGILGLLAIGIAGLATRKWQQSENIVGNDPDSVQRRT